MYTVMFYRNREPVIITIDDFFPTNKDVSTISLILLFSQFMYLSKVVIILPMVQKRSGQ